jgi:hypothetical protein
MVEYISNWLTVTVLETAPDDLPYNPDKRIPQVGGSLDQQPQVPNDVLPPMQAKLYCADQELQEHHHNRLPQQGVQDHWLTCEVTFVGSVVELLQQTHINCWVSLKLDRSPNYSIDHAIR